MSRRQRRIFPGDGDTRHGTANGYNNLGCRCEPCTAAWAVNQRERRWQPRPPLPPNDRRHGSDVAYSYWRCRCRRCRDFIRDVKRAQAMRARITAEDAAPWLR